MLSRVLEALGGTQVSAHCDLPCGVYDPAQARIEAESVKAIIEKFNDSDDPAFRQRALIIKEERSDLVKHHLWVLWTDYFKPPHFEKYPNLHELFNEATKLAGAAAAPRRVGRRGGRSAARQDRRDREDLLGDQGSLTYRLIGP
jgi:nickel superoxide dismutase